MTCWPSRRGEFIMLSALIGGVRNEEAELGGAERLNRVIIKTGGAVLKLPGNERAKVERSKLTDYCLNTAHPTGKNKARVFSSALGLTVTDAPQLQNMLLEA